MSLWQFQSRCFGNKAIVVPTALRSCVRCSDSVAANKHVASDGFTAEPTRPTPFEIKRKGLC
jgi:hypothetical protein